MLSNKYVIIQVYCPNGKTEVQTFESVNAILENNGLHSKLIAEGDKHNIRNELLLYLKGIDKHLSINKV